jgi:hypothetical protein
MLLLYLVAYIEKKTRKTDIIFNLVHVNVTNISCHYVGECEFLWLEIGINLIKKFCVFGNTNKGANFILIFVEQSLKGTPSSCFSKRFRLRLKFNTISLESRNVKIKPINLSEMIFWIECDEVE